MDKTDINLIMLLSANSRLPYSQLAKSLNLSVAAVHKRIQLLVESGVIRRFTAKIGLLGVPGLVVFLWGTSMLDSLSGLVEKLKDQDLIYWLVEGGGKFLYISAYLRTLNELPRVVSYVKKEACIPEPTVGIMAGPVQPLPTFKHSDLVLCKLDFKIIQALKDDSRKAISDVAAELGVSTKTARRRLNRMVKNHLVELGVEWYPDKSNDIFTLVDLHFKSEADLTAVSHQILHKHAPNTLFFWYFANIPGLVTFTIWANSMNELQTLREKLEAEPFVTLVVPNILLKGYVFKIWRDRIVETTNPYFSTNLSHE